MLATKCSKCHSKLLRISGYNNRKRLTIGDFCPECLVFINYTNEFHKAREIIIKENKDRKKSKAKFLKKQRMACSFCLNDKENPKENRTKWTIRKMPKKKDEPQRWKGTCQLCGNIWTTDSGEQYNYYPDGYQDYEMMGI